MLGVWGLNKSLGEVWKEVSERAGVVMIVKKLNEKDDSIFGATYLLIKWVEVIRGSKVNFKWDMLNKDFLCTITFKTHEKSIFKNYKESIVSLAWRSI